MTLQVYLAHNLETSELAEISALLASVGMRARSAQDMFRAVRSSEAVAVAKIDQAIVGFGRLIGDGVYYGSLWDVAVSLEHQGQGIGQAIVKKLMSVAAEQRLQLVGLFTGSHNDAFYEQLGFLALRDIHAMTSSPNGHQREVIKDEK